MINKRTLDFNSFIKRYKYHFYITLTIVWMVFIYVNSAFEGAVSARLSDTLIQFVLSIIKWILRGPGAESIEQLIKSEGFHMFMRKVGHFTEFGILGLFIFAGLGFFQSIHSIILKRFFIGLSICTVYAISDEVHQLFVAGRVFSYIDILIDFAGAFLMTGIVVLIFRRRWTDNE